MKIEAKNKPFDWTHDIVIVPESESQIDELIDLLVSINYNFKQNSVTWRSVQALFHKAFQSNRKGFRLTSASYGDIAFYEEHIEEPMWGKPIECVYMNTYINRINDLKDNIIEYSKHHPHIIDI